MIAGLQASDAPRYRHELPYLGSHQFSKAARILFTCTPSAANDFFFGFCASSRVLLTAGLLVIDMARVHTSLVA